MVGELGAEVEVEAVAGSATCTAKRTIRNRFSLSTVIAHATEIRFAHLSQRLGLDGIDGFGFATDTHDKVWCFGRAEGGEKMGRDRE